VAHTYVGLAAARDGRNETVRHRPADPPGRGSPLPDWLPAAISIDVAQPHQTHAVLLRSPHANARIRALDSSAAAALPGVLAVLTGEDLARDGIGTIPCMSGLVNRDQSAMAMPAATRPWRRTGCAMSATRVAMVVAATAAIARDATEAIAVEYEPLPAVVDTAHALDPASPRCWDQHPGNLCFDWETGDGAAVGRAAAAARHRWSLTPRQQPHPSSTRVNRARARRIRSGRGQLHVWSSTQGSHFLRNLLAEHVSRPGKPHPGW